MSPVLGVQMSGSQFDHSGPHSSTKSYGENRSSSLTQGHSQGVQSSYSSGLPTPPTTTSMTGISIGHNYANHPMVQHYANGHNNGSNSSRHSRIPSDLYSNASCSSRRSSVHEPEQVEQDKINAIASHLQIPESINKSKGSLAEFAAEITCLFWFEDAATLQYAEELAIEAYPNRGLVPDATPTPGFRKWVTTILSTTQVGKNVILLALMFIYRLKKFNPSVSGKRGSEFRLLTIALMLGNKFLDDNTYTNKTWADVSGISVTEIHIMEVEFLSNMRYELYASQADWTKWKNVLGRFGSFYEKAIRIQATVEPKGATAPITPTSQTFPYKLPSPPSMQYNHSNTNYNTLPNPMSNLPQLPRSPVRPSQSNAATYERKRSLDSVDAPLLPPAKRIHHHSTASDHLSPALFNPTSVQLPHSNTVSLGGSPADFNGPRVPQLPMPRITTNNPSLHSHLAPLSLPPRAMASVYPAVSSGWNQPLTPTSAILPNMSGQHQTSISPLGDGLRGQNAINSNHTSPVNLYGPSTPTRPGLSPSYFLTNRSSPYRPVRHVNTLLIPPPSAAMQNSVRSIDYQQMHYQPLGRPATERRSGPVPYLYPDHQSQSHVSTPTVQQYRPH